MITTHHQPGVIGLFADSVGAGLATLVKVLADSPGNVVLFARKEIGRRLMDHEAIYPFLEKLESIELRDYPDSAEFQFDTLYVTWAHSLCFTAEDRAVLKRILPHAKRKVLLYDGNFGTYRDMLKQQLRNLISEFDLLRQMDAICYMTVYPKRDLFSVVKRRFPLSVGPNIDLLYDSGKLLEFYAEWNPNAPRQFAISCSGNKATSVWRTELVDHLEQGLRKSPGLTLVEDESRTGPGKVIVWSVNGRRLNLAAYVDILSQSDFVLCIPGTSWTHRPFESLVRGAIPIIDENNLRIHDVPWVDGENCLIVRQPAKKESWAVAIQRALALRQPEIFKMRERVRALREEWLLPAAFSARLRSKLGFSPAMVQPQPALVSQPIL